MTENKNPFWTWNGKRFYRIENYHRMPPFLIQIATSSDIWLFLSSNGGITAGRCNADQAFLPYETDDKLHDSRAGAKAFVKVKGQIWEPFQNSAQALRDTDRALAKSLDGTCVMFEEVNHSLGLRYRYRYETSQRYGLVKTMQYENLGGGTVEVELIDGMQNILPYGVSASAQSERSTLIDAYKANEWTPEGVAVYSLTTQINDTPDPIEMLRANVAWTTGGGEVCLDPDAGFRFAQGLDLKFQTNCYGCRGAFWVHRRVRLMPEEKLEFAIVIDGGYDYSRLTVCRRFVEARRFDALEQDIRHGAERLRKIVGQADGIQKTGDEVACAYHYMNTLYNVMRGGTFEHEYALDLKDFRRFVDVRNKKLAQDGMFWDCVKDCKTVQQLKEATSYHPDAFRLALEYMPLSFSRRHGDPSRPWNRFHIRAEGENWASSYEGNWRDIFQNWEAVGLAFPLYYENMVAKFVNASTVDGGNPYRINQDGIEWERPDADHAFSSIGYWGDHQIIYLLRLLEGMDRYIPERLRMLLTDEVFCYADVPYEIKPFDDILTNSKATIVFREDKDRQISERCRSLGTDGRLCLSGRDVYRVTLAEKLVVPALAKVCNLLENGGIWMNTQKPEWNDANNAIVGIGLSMVTVYHLNAYLDFVVTLFGEQSGDVFCSKEVALWLHSVEQILESTDRSMLSGAELLCLLGREFSRYRTTVYKTGMSGKERIPFSALRKALKVCRDWVAQTARAGKGDVYATYNLVDKDFTVRPMGPMLEGQTAAIGSGLLNQQQMCELLSALDILYLPQRRAHALYPVRKTTPFIEKNNLWEMCPEVPGITIRDEDGVLHFDAAITTAQKLDTMLKTVACDAEQSRFLRLEFERVFQHGSFCGRSQTMYKYEGIGCVYWHQNAKLALAVLELVAHVRKQGQDASVLYQRYRELIEGFLYRKSAAKCGAIPIEPYSHTSYNGRAEQPGMTGQVKESLLMRRLELGVLVEKGCICFDPWFLSEREFGQSGISFTICGCPVHWLKGETNRLEVEQEDGSVCMTEQLVLDRSLSFEVFARTGNIKEIRVTTVCSA